MIQSKGAHFLHDCFPPLSGKTLTCPSMSSADIQLFFSDGTAYQLPEAVMYYLDSENIAAIGWTLPWMPPQHFVDRVMRGGTISFIPTPDLAPEASVRQTFNICCIGYLSKKDGDAVIYDTHGGDVGFEEGIATEAQFGELPDRFIERMKIIVNAAIEQGRTPGCQNNTTLDLDLDSERVLAPFPFKDPTFSDYIKLTHLLAKREAERLNQAEPDSWTYYIAESLEWLECPEANCAVATLLLSGDKERAKEFFSKVLEVLEASGCALERSLCQYPYIVTNPDGLALLKLRGASIHQLSVLSEKFSEALILVTGCFPTVIDREKDGVYSVHITNISSPDFNIMVDNEQSAFFSRFVKEALYKKTGIRLWSEEGKDVTFYASQPIAEEIKKIILDHYDLLHRSGYLKRPDDLLAQPYSPRPGGR